MCVDVGIDVSKEHLDVCVLHETGEVEVERLTNDAAGHVALSTKLQVYRDVHVVLEATGVYHQLPTQHLQQQGLLVSIINPRQTQSYAKSQNRRNKTDAVDALLLAQFSRERRPTASVSSESTNTTHKTLLREVQALKEDLSRLRNRLEAAEHGVSHPDVVTSLKRRIELAEQEKDALEKRLEQELESKQSELALLTSIPGIACRTACALLAEMGDIKRFSSASALVAWAGLTPKRFESGKLRAYAAISRMGSATLRHLLYMPAVCASRWNPLIHTFYQRLLDKGKPKKVALVACMAKLLRIVYGVLVSGKPFNPNLSS